MKDFSLANQKQQPSCCHGHEKPCQTPAHKHEHEHEHDHAHEHEHEHAHQHDHACCASDACDAALNLTQPKLDKTNNVWVYHIQAMDCPVEAKLLDKVLRPISAVSDLSFDLMNRQLSVVYSDVKAQKQVEAAIASTGMSAVLVDKETAANPVDEAPVPWIKRWGTLIAAAGLACAAEVMAWMGRGDSNLLVIACAILAILIGGRTTLKKGWIALKNYSLNIHFLMSLAVIGAMVIGQWPEAAMVLVLFELAERLEAMSLNRARQAVQSLMANSPKVARVWHQEGEDGHWHEMPVADVRVGEKVLIAAGESVPLDGELVSGAGFINEAAITGESLPVEKAIGDMVYAGTLNGQSDFQIRTTAPASETVLARIIASIREAQASKAPTERFVDKFAKIYTPAVVLLACLLALILPWVSTYTWQESLYNALVLLVIACPCALVIATPVTLVSALASAAKQGILIKGGAPLEQASKVSVIAFDKTGTLTKGEPAVLAVQPFNQNYPAEQVLSIAASLDQFSSHPIAKAICQAAAGLRLASVEDKQEIAGEGVNGRIGNKHYAIGGQRLANRYQFDIQSLENHPEASQQAGATPLLVFEDQNCMGVIWVADAVRAESENVVDALKQKHYLPVVLSGDQTTVVKQLAQSLNIQQAYGNLLPEDKLAHIRQLSQTGQAVAMIGDGVNDAPAMAAADLSIAMGGAGSDTAMETAEVVIMDDYLGKVPQLLTHAKRSMRTLHFSIFIALFVKAVFFVLALSGVATLWMAVFADVGTSLIVVMNGLRLLKFKSA